LLHEPLSTRRQLELLRDLQRLANERWHEESRIRTALEEGLRTAENQQDEATATIEREFTAGRAAATTLFDEAVADARHRYEQDRNAAQQQYKGLRHGVESEAERVKEAAHNEQQQASWEALTVFDALKGRPRERYLETVKRLERSDQEIAVLEHDAAVIMKMRRQWREFPAVSPRDDNSAHAGNNKAHRVVLGRPGSRAAAVDVVEQALARVDELTNALRDAAIALQRQTLPRWFEGGTPFGILFVMWLLFVAPSGMLVGWSGWQWIAISFGAAVLGTLGLLAWFWPIAWRQSGEQFQTVQQLVADARRAVVLAVEAARERGRHEARALVSERDEQLTAVQIRWSASVSAGRKPR
jgi:hypothetical protein